MKAASLHRLQKLVVILSDGEFHSGEKLANILGVSRTAIWKLTNKLESWGIELFSIRGKGYKIPNGLTLIDSEYLANQITEHAKLFSSIEVLYTVDSTSSYLARNWSKGNGEGHIVVSEHQTGGRGRNGKTWISPFGSNLYFSLGSSLPMGLSALGGLSLAIGIGLTKFFNQHTNKKVKLKWPNDLLVEQRKLAGILVEASGDSNDNSFLNIGIGLNWKMSSKSQGIEQPWINLSEILNRDIDRNKLLARILLELDEILSDYIDNGFESFRARWAEYSAYYGKSIVLTSHKGSVSGIEAGIDNMGALRLKMEAGEKTFYSGEVSLRSLQS
ncbi:MAG: bifunctional biotin--[acetyl-CoA-carboxylase] ligase/biotin operon repressor BirA [Kangiellaceae bacterium]|nr:bifunctional biotin--[acetyl-CoA-carboxylase] ligase/biotin operon repressor BirA [Kangiellaceae bacterium]